MNRRDFAGRFAASLGALLSSGRTTSPPLPPPTTARPLAGKLGAAGAVHGLSAVQSLDELPGFPQFHYTETRVVRRRRRLRAEPFRA